MRHVLYCHHGLNLYSISIILLCFIFISTTNAGFFNHPSTSKNVKPFKNKISNTKKSFASSFSSNESTNSSTTTTTTTTTNPNPNPNANYHHYAKARNDRAEYGHDAAIQQYRTLLTKINPNDFTASSRIAAAHSSPDRHDSLFQNYATNNTNNNSNNNNNNQKKFHHKQSHKHNHQHHMEEDIIAFRKLLSDCQFTHSNIQTFFGIVGEEAFAMGPVYIKPVMAGSFLGLPSFVSSIGSKVEEECKDETDMTGRSTKKSSIPQNNDMDEKDLGLRCLIAMFLLGFSVPHSILEKSLPNPKQSISLLKRLHFIFPCELDPTLLVPYVQLFPLDLPLDNHITDINSNIDIKTNQTTSHKSLPSSSSSSSSSSVSSTLTKSLIFVTDWHPNVLSTTTVGNNNDGAVMYIGPDSLALVQHLSQSILVQQLEKTFQKNKETNKQNHNDDDDDGGGGGGGGVFQMMDFCSGSGIQAITTLAMLNHIDNCSLRPISKPDIKYKVSCFDVNERALRFIKLNTYLNGYSEQDITPFKMNLLQKEERDYIVHTWKDSVQIILANPPFIPVPPSTEQILKRYGLFSSGGPDGEDVLREIVSLAPLLLKGKGGGSSSSSDDDSDGGGLLAIVSEFMNPTLDSDILERIQQWWFQHTLTDMKKELQFLLPSTSRTSGLLFTNEYPVSAHVYASRRATNEKEFIIWRNHLQNLGIKNVSPGLLFLQSREIMETNQFQPQNNWDVDHVVVPKSDLGSIWTPHNRHAVEFTRESWDEKQRNQII